MSERKVYLNGRIVPADEAKISAFDAGLLHGASVFSTMLAHNGKVFRLDRHLARLAESAELLGLQVEQTSVAIRVGVLELLEATGLSEARVRITVTPGPLGGGGEPAEPTLVITADPLPDYPASWYEKGILVVVSSFKQITGSPVFGHKTGCYLPRVLARREAAGKGAEEALWYTPDGRLAEACFCNVFLVRGGKVCTPPVDTPVLPGVVREAVLELCRDHGIEADADTPLTVKEMLAADEAFLTSSTMGIRPISQIEKHPVGESVPGKVTDQLMHAYRQMLQAECPPEDAS